MADGFEGGGVSEFRSALSNLSLRSARAIAAAHERMADEMAEQMSREVPSESGRLAETITSGKFPNSRLNYHATVGDEDTDYLGQVEYGGTNRDQPAQPFVRPAIANADSHYVDEMERAVGRSLG